MFASSIDNCLANWIAPVESEYLNRMRSGHVSMLKKNLLRAQHLKTALSTIVDSIDAVSLAIFTSIAAITVSIGAFSAAPLLASAFCLSSSLIALFAWSPGNISSVKYNIEGCIDPARYLQRIVDHEVKALKSHKKLIAANISILTIAPIAFFTYLACNKTR